MRLFAVLVTLVYLTTLAGLPPAFTASVPRELQGIYTELDAHITRFDAVVGSRWNGRRSPVVFSTELLPANGHVGAGLVRPQQMDVVKLTLDRLQSLGVRAVTVQISFPMLYRPFFRSDEEYAAYLNFYRRLATEVRSRDLKLIAKTQALFSKGGWTDLDVARFYRGLTLDQYVQGRAQVALTIARELRPDFLSVVMEPDTEADQTGLPMNTPANSVRVVRAILAHLKEAGISGIQVGAGTGTWHPQYEAFTRAYAAAGVDYIDLHVYPVNRDFLDRAFTMARIARQAGKRVAMSEAWLYKAGSVDLTKGFSAVDIFGRDAFSFWEPLDQKFLEVMVRFAHAERLLFFSPFWTKYFHAYVDYAAAKSLSPAQLVAFSTQAAGKALVAGEFTETGLTYKSLIPAGPRSGVPALEMTVVAPDGGRVAWSHERNLIAFDRTGPRGTFDIYTIRPDGAEDRCLTCDQQGLPRSHRGNPAWHPSGAYIVFQSHDPRLQTGRGRVESYLGTPGIGINNDVWITAADGSRAWRLTRVRPGEGVLHPHFSHDGRHLLWSEIVDPSVRGMGGQWVIRLADFSIEAGSPRLQNVRTLRPGNLQLYETHGFSPDDRRILFSASPPGGNYYDLEIYSYEPASGTLTRLTRNDEWDEHAQFTADGRHIVWASSEAIAQRKDPRDLRLDYWMMNADGLEKRRLTRFNASGSPEFRPNTLVADFEFGPDGKTIVAKIGAAGRGETVVLIRLFH